MRVAIIGAGQAGLFLGAALAQRGHQVTAVERDPGPSADGTWPRKGVMQFHHAHGFRLQVTRPWRPSCRERCAAGRRPGPSGP